MNIEELGKLLSGKRRTVSDLARFLSTRTDNNPNYTLLLGAGCSISSGIRSAESLLKQWRSEFCPATILDVADQRRYLKEQFGQWYDPNREYSSLFEKKYDLQRQRRMFVETEVAGKTPSLGYAYLTALISNNYFNTVFTTNFDDLINEAFYLYSDQRPIVCAHDSSINSITVTSKRPKIVKLHGDYLFDDLKSTARETESLEQNMRAKFAEFARDYGLIVVGYSANDRSIMDALSTLLKSDDYFRNGIYWCLRDGADVSEELRKLLWKEKTYFVEIEGFDELFAELYSTFNNGEVLPISTVSVTRRPAETASRLLIDQAAFDTKSPILRKAREQLIKQTKRTTLMGMMVRPDTDEINEVNEKLSDDELITELEIQNLITLNNYPEAIGKGRLALNASPGRVARGRLLSLVIRAHQFAGDLDNAIAAADELIALEPYQASHHLRKASLLRNSDQKIQTIDKAIAVNKYFAPCYAAKARLYVEQAKISVGADRERRVAAAYDQLDTGLSRDPSLANSCWRIKYDLINDFERDIQLRNSKLDDIITCLSVMSPHSYRVLSMRLARLLSQDDKAALEALIADLDEIKQHSDPTRHADLDELRLQAIASSRTSEQVRDAIAVAQASHDLVHCVDLAVVIAGIKRDRLGLDGDAVQLLAECLKVDFDHDAAKALISALIDLRRFDEAEDYFNKYANRLSASTRNDIKMELLDEKQDFDAALAEISKQTNQTGNPNITLRLYFMLRKGLNSEAEIFGREALTAQNFALDLEREIVNYEIACKRTKGKVSTHRLDKLLGFTRSDSTKAAILALLGRKAELLDVIRKQMKLYKSFRFHAVRWPCFEDVRSDAEFQRAISVPPKSDPALTIVPLPAPGVSPLASVR